MKIAFIGAGKMAGALAAGVVKSGLVSAENICGCARSEESRTRFMERFEGVKPLWQTDPLQAISGADLIVLAIKPQQFSTVLPLLKPAIKQQLILSVAAGIKTTSIEQWLGESSRVIRSMPNTPAMVGEGITAIACGANATERDLQCVEKILSSVGRCVRVEESMMNAVTSVSGSGPAYVYHFINGLIDGGVEQGLTAETARALAAQTVLGAARMVLSMPQTPIEMAAQVKSPGGTTLAGCAALEAGGFEELIRKGVAAAKKRADELS